MNIQKFTQKSIEAVNDCEKLAYDYGNQEIEQEHLLVALLEQEDGLIAKLIEKMEINLAHFTENAKKKLDNAKSALETLNSPTTGDTGKIWMWFALLFVSGGGLLGTIAYRRKRKETEN